MANIRVVTTRAPGLLPALMRETARTGRPVILVPESFTLACETEIIRQSGAEGIFDLKIFSPSSLIREIRELTGHGKKRPLSGDGQNMVLSQVLHHCREQLGYYRDSVAQPSLAARIADQIDDFTRARLNPEFLRAYHPDSRRTAAKLQDLALIWERYQAILDQGFEDTVSQWMSAVRRVPESGLLRDSRLLIFGFDYITHDLMNLVETACVPGAAAEIVLGMISDDIGPDREIFRSANDSVEALKDLLARRGKAFSVERFEDLPALDPGIAYVEKTLYAQGPFAEGKTYFRSDRAVVLREDPVLARNAALQALADTRVPDLSHVRTYYARNAYRECQHACRTLIGWHQAGIPWEEMAVAVCEPQTLPSLLPLTLAAAGIPFNAKQDQPMLMSAYAQYFLSLLRVLRLNFRQEDVLRLIKTGFTPLTDAEIMDMENYAREHGIHRRRWLEPFYLPEQEERREAVLRLEDLRRQVIEPIAALRRQLSARSCGGREAATLLFGYLTEAGVYDRLLAQEEALAARGDDLGIDRNRQVWTAVNDLLDMAATFLGDEPVPLQDLCAMLEASVSSRTIKSLPQRSRAVTVAPPQVFFSSGIRCMLVMGLQENEISPGAGILSEAERSQLETYIETSNHAFYLEAGSDGHSSGESARPYPRIGQSLLDLAARQKQDVYQAVSLAREQLVLSCSGAKPSGGVLTPSAAFRRLSRVLEQACPENCTGGLMDSGLPPFAPVFALEALAVRLRETRDSPDSFLGGTGEEDRRWQDALAGLYHSDAWRTKTEGVLKGLHLAPPKASIPPDRASRLYLSHSMSISRVETFGSCPYRHLLQYGLDLFPAGSYTFQRNEQGTFNHDVLQAFLAAAMKLSEWPDLSEETQTRLLNRILRERARRWEGTILTADPLHRYQGAGIIRGVRTSVASLMRAFQQQPHFLPMAVEVPFGTPDESGRVRLPALRIPTADGSAVAFTGRIDRIDRLQTEDGKNYFMIVDHKMSSREVRRNSIVAGLQLQLPLYVRAAQLGLTRYEAAGGLYQPIRDVLVDADTPEKIRDKVDKALQTSGMILDSSRVQEAMKPVKLSRKSETSDTVSVVTPEEMNRIMDCAVEVVTERVNQIRAGEVSPRPVQDGPESPCSWCEHADACKYDPTLPGCRIPEIKHK